MIKPFIFTRKSRHLTFVMLFSVVLLFAESFAKSPIPTPPQTSVDIQSPIEQPKALQKVSALTQEKEAVPLLQPYQELDFQESDYQEANYQELDYQELESRNFYSKAAFVVDRATNRVLFEKNQDIIVPIASLSKLMMAMVVQDANQNMKELITITEDDIDTLRNTRSHLFVGLQLRRQDALLLALMSSENRAANALARHYPSGLTGFIKAMNRKAKALGMRQTRFVEPTGLSSQNISTPRELALMVETAYQYPIIRHASTTRSIKTRIDGKIIPFHNTNPFIKSSFEDMVMDIELSKTGYIRESGFCLAFIATIDSRPVTVILMNAASSFKRTQDLYNLQDFLQTLFTKQAISSKVAITKKNNRLDQISLHLMKHHAIDQR